jgi:hypothetical protein
MTAGGEGDGGLALSMVGGVTRGVGTYLVEGSNDAAAAIPAAITNGLLPVVGGAGLFAATSSDDEEEADTAEIDVALVGPMVGGMLVVGSVITAVEASIAFEERWVDVQVGVSPGFVSVKGTF